MSLPAPPRRHLNASEGREVVYCHACQNEWYRDEHAALECPRCHGDITEIVSPENDPRNLQDEAPGFGPAPAFDHYHESNSDPGEADIEQHVHRTPTGMFMHRTLGPRAAANQPDPEIAVLQRFTDMLMEFNGGQPGRSGPETLFPAGPPMPPAGGDPNAARAGSPGLSRTTFRRTPFGTTTVTISTFSGPPVGPRGHPDFGAVFGNLMNPAPPAEGDRAGANDPNGAGAQEQPGQRPMHLHAVATTLQGLLAMFLDPAAASHGDAVYTQEALDRIITQLMEQNPPPNAAPPASQEAISKLGKRTVELKDLGTDGKAECTICIDELHVGDEVTVLPCKHWFHGECVTLWLKEHNTCPICRNPIEERNRSGNNNGGSQQQQQQQQQQEPGHGWEPSDGLDRLDRELNTHPGNQDPAPSNSQNSRARYERLFNGPGGTSEERLNAIRNLGGGYRPSASRTNSSSQQPSQSQRRSSHSPPPEPSTRSPRVRSPASRSRFRPEESSMQGSEWYNAGEGREVSGDTAGDRWDHRDREGDRDRNGDRLGGNGPLSWLRDQWSRHSGSSGSGGPGDGRRS